MEAESRTARPWMVILAEPPQGRLVVMPDNDDAELVPTQPAENAAGYDLLDGAREMDERRIARRMAGAVVQHLEIVHVELQVADRMLGAMKHVVGQRFEDMRAIEHARQSIPIGLFPRLLCLGSNRRHLPRQPVMTGRQDRQQQETAGKPGARQHRLHGGRQQAEKAQNADDDNGDDQYAHAQRDAAVAGENGRKIEIAAHGRGPVKTSPYRNQGLNNR